MGQVAKFNSVLHVFMVQGELTMKTVYFLHETYTKAISLIYKCAK